MSDKDDDKPRLEPNKSPVSVRRAKKLHYLSEYLSKQESRKNCKKVSKILKKSEHERTEDEKATLADHEDIVKRISKNKEKRKLNHLRTLETEDNEELLQSKCVELAKIIKKSKKTVIYTGAGISTAASIPDYRGPQGVWTLLQKGEQLEPQDLSDAEPTITHMCIRQLHEHGHVKHVVSQNCDGLHMRSGLPRQVLSEVHGDMFIEICHNCRPHREYIRLFDVTENTGVRRHFTGRYCQKCCSKLKDTIVHFGEKGGMKSPYRWKEAVKAANKCDLILCLGSSLKILKKYACLWCMDRAKHKRPNLVIVNLQWTPKDESATLKVNGKCDEVMVKVMKLLGYSIPKYSRLEDPIFHLATNLEEDELETTSKKVLQAPDCIPRLRSHGISRTPTPSDSSDSQISSASSIDSCDVQNDLIDRKSELVNNAYVSAGVSVPNIKHSQDFCTKQKMLPNAKDVCLSKSERICNEAKIAMQERLVNAKLSEMYATCQGLHQQTAHSSDGPKFTTNGLVHHGTVQSDGTVGLMPKPQYDPLCGGPFDPGPSTYQDKLVYLQMLQSQLGELKRKQKILKEQEEHTMIQQVSPQTGSSKQVSQTGSSLSNQVIHTSGHVTNQDYLQSLLTTDTVQLLQTKLQNNSHSTKSPISQLASPPMKKDDVLTCPIKMDLKSGEVVKLEHGVNSAANSRKTIKISDLESKLKQNLKEQKAMKARLESMSASQTQVEDKAHQQHQCEQLQLQQQFLVQEQLRQQGSTKDANSKQGEMLKLLVFQQQALIAQQNSQMLLLRQKYLSEVQKIDNLIEKLKKSQIELENYLQKLKHEIRIEIPSQSNITLVSPNRLLSPPVYRDQVVDSKIFQTDLKTSPLPLKVEHSPSRKDHSIAALLHGTSPNRSNDKLLKGSANSGMLIMKSEQPSSCVSCQFLKDYGMSKKRCVKCDELKVQQSVSHGPNIASPSNSVAITFPSYVPNIQHTLTDSGNLSNYQADVSLLNHDYAIDSRVRNRKVSVCKSSMPSQDGNNEIYLISPKGSKGRNSTSTIVTVSGSLNTLKCDKIDFKHKEVHVTIPTSSGCASVSQGNTKLSPLISYATSTAENISCASNRMKSHIYKAYNHVKKKEEEDSDLKNNEVTFSLPDEKSEEVINDLKVCEKDIAAKGKSGLPVRSHSQSEISDSNIEPVQGKRHARCHSQSDVDSTVNDGVEAASSVEVSDAGEEISKPGRKRKLTRCISVPGWFGKGLNMKKRRRY